MSAFRIDRRSLLAGAGRAAFGAPLLAQLFARPARADGARARRVIFFYFPDGVAGVSQNGEPSLWHPTGSEHDFQLTEQLEPLGRHKQDCLFFRGLSLGPTDSGSHPGGAKKLLTAVDGGNGESIDQRLARTAGASAPHRHVYLGAMANQNNASGDKHISYPSPGQSTPPEDDPLRAFERLFGQVGASSGSPSGSRSNDASASSSADSTVIDAILDDVNTLRGRLGNLERQRLDRHLESVREVERRIKAASTMPPKRPRETCAPRAPAPRFEGNELYRPERFPEILTLQIDLLVEAMACGLTQVGTIQASHHTSELLMNRFPDTEMTDPGYDMGSHHASHYGASHDRARRELSSYLKQRRWFVAQFSRLLDALADRQEDGGTMLDHSLVLLFSEVCDGNTHIHDDMPFVLAGRGGGTVSTGRLLQYGYERHAGLLTSMARAMGEPLGSFGDTSSGPLSGVLR